MPAKTFDSPTMRLRAICDNAIRAHIGNYQAAKSVIFAAVSRDPELLLVLFGDYREQALRQAVNEAGQRERAEKKKNLAAHAN